MRRARIAALSLLLTATGACSTAHTTAHRAPVYAVVVGSWPAHGDWLPVTIERANP